jgi:threonine/homoserine/homoserine lactone efflux protein
VAAPTLLALAGFSFVSAATPGPNNVLLWASGATFGFRRTMPHILGTAIGIGAMALVVAAGLGALVTALPGLATAMKIGGSLYLLYLAIQIARAGSLQRADVARPLSVAGAAAFQAINPKAWIFALGAMSTFRPNDLPIPAGSVLVAVTMMLVIVPSAALWAIGGEALNRLISGERTRRAVSLVLATLVAATVITVWL